MRQEDWTQQMRDKMADYESAVPEGLWRDIEQSLSQQKAVAKPLWHRWASVAAIAVLVLGAGWWLWPKNEENAVTQPIEKTTRQHTLIAAAPDYSTEPVFAPVSEPVSRKSIQTDMIEEKMEEKIQETEEETEENQQEQTVRQEQAVTHPVTSTRQQQENTHSPTPPAKNKTVSLGLYINSGLLAQNQTNSAADKFLSYDEAAEPIITGTPSYNNNHIEEQKEHHHQPVSWGLTLSYPILPHWKLATGLVYTRLHSEFVTNKSTTDQRLHYLGFPVSLQYHLLDGRQWKAYVAAGVQIDWNIDARQERNHTDFPVEKDRIQWSVGGAVGVEYDILPQLGIYAEPGLRYYPDNGSEIKNYFKDKPTSWNLQFGIRLNLGK